MLFRAHLLSPDASAHLLEIPDGALLVDAAGRIAAVGTFDALTAAHPQEPCQDLRPLWILSGIIVGFALIPAWRLEVFVRRRATLSA